MMSPGAESHFHYVPTVFQALCGALKVYLILGISLHAIFHRESRLRALGSY